MRLFLLASILGLVGASQAICQIRVENLEERFECSSSSGECPWVYQGFTLAGASSDQHLAEHLVRISAETFAASPFLGGGVRPMGWARATVEFDVLLDRPMEVTRRLWPVGEPVAEFLDRGRHHIVLSSFSQAFPFGPPEVRHSDEFRAQAPEPTTAGLVICGLLFLWLQRVKQQVYRRTPNEAQQRRQGDIGAR